MRSIQEVGSEILQNNPSKFYVFCGSEYGIKLKYISLLAEYYGRKIEGASILSIIDHFSKKQLIPEQPSLYVVRYDEDFLSKLDAGQAEKIKKCKIIGTIVCIYEEFNKGYSKIEKYLSDFSVIISEVNSVFISKYLHADFPQLPDRFINIAVDNCSNYGDAYNMCISMKHANVEQLYQYSDSDISSMFGKSNVSTDKLIRYGFASRNFSCLINALDKYEGNYDSILYMMLNTLMELEKLLLNKKSSSDIKEYANRWTLEDVYNMFMNTYSELYKLRSYSSDWYSSLVYLFSLLKFSKIPCEEEMCVE